MSKENLALFDSVIDSLVDFKKAFYKHCVLIYKGIAPGILIQETEYEDELYGKTTELMLVFYDNFIRCLFDSEDGGRNSWNYELTNDWDGFEDVIFSIWPYPNSDITATYTNMPYWDCSDSGHANCLEESLSICESKILELSKLAEFRNHKDTLADLIRQLRNNQARWYPSRIRWEYIKDLDDCIKNMKLLGIEIKQEDSTPTQNPEDNGQRDEDIHRSGMDLLKLAKLVRDADYLIRTEDTKEETVLNGYSEKTAKAVHGAVLLEEKLHPKIEDVLGIESASQFRRELQCVLHFMDFEQIEGGTGRTLLRPDCPKPWRIESKEGESLAKHIELIAASLNTQTQTPNGQAKTRRKRGRKKDPKVKTRNREIAQYKAHNPRKSYKEIGSKFGVSADVARKACNNPVD